METKIYVKKSQVSQELINDEASFKGTLMLTIETIGSKTAQQEEIDNISSMRLMEVKKQL